MDEGGLTREARRNASAHRWTFFGLVWMFNAIVVVVGEMPISTYAFSPRRRVFNGKNHPDFF